MRSTRRTEARKTEGGGNSLPPEIRGIGGINRGNEGAFTAAELEALRAAFTRGAKGSLLVGLRRRRRLLTALLPPQTTEAAAALQAGRAAARLRALRCDGYLHARRVRLSTTRPPGQVVEGLVVEERVGDAQAQRVVPLDRFDGIAAFRTVSPEHRLRDRVSLALEAAFDGALPTEEPG